MMGKSPRYTIVIVGCGRLGGRLANQLSADGHRVTVVDTQERAFDKLTNEFSGYRILGDAIEMHILRQAETGQADYLFTTTHSDNTNLMVAQVAKTQFHVPHVLARVFDPAREAIYADFGIATVSPTNLSALAFLSAMQQDEDK
jgi:trk system potassium uptake protein TrkA